ncbi:hypothetical protein TrVGV298_004594 [Trichoderma virens]|nr:hypothetical protein TrVGV298_004594 [Trichoderma virens]
MQVRPSFQNKVPSLTIGTTVSLIVFIAPSEFSKFPNNIDLCPPGLFLYVFAIHLCPLRLTDDVVQGQRFRQDSGGRGSVFGRWGPLIGSWVVTAVAAVEDDVDAVDVLVGVGEKEEEEEEEEMLPTKAAATTTTTTSRRLLSPVGGARKVLSPAARKKSWREHREMPAFRPKKFFFAAPEQHQQQQQQPQPQPQQQQLLLPAPAPAPAPALTLTLAPGPKKKETKEKQEKKEANRPKKKKKMMKTKWSSSSSWMKP